MRKMLKYITKKLKNAQNAEIYCNKNSKMQKKLKYIGKNRKYEKC